MSSLAPMNQTSHEYKAVIVVACLSRRCRNVERGRKNVAKGRWKTFHRSGNVVATAKIMQPALSGDWLVYRKVRIRVCQGR
jgi:hypothetical protein